MLLLIPQRCEFSSKSQLRRYWDRIRISCCWYHKGTNFQANHNSSQPRRKDRLVVADTTKVRIFKQITTSIQCFVSAVQLLLIPQRYEFSSKSQPYNDFLPALESCCWYHKGTNFQANHNRWLYILLMVIVVADTTKVRIFKQITTQFDYQHFSKKLLLIPQRYEFSSKSQQVPTPEIDALGCCWYHKGTNFQANHNT